MSTTPHREESLSSNSLPIWTTTDLPLASALRIAGATFLYFQPVGDSSRLFAAVFMADDTLAEARKQHAAGAFETLLTSLNTHDETHRLLKEARARVERGGAR